MGRRVKAKAVHQAQSRPRWQTVAVCLLLAAAVWVVFGQTRHFEFVNYDDDLYVYDNPAIIHGLSWNGVVWAFTHCVADNWHPLTVLSHMLDCQLYGLQPGGHHLTNVLLHAATTVLLFLLLQKLTGAFWRSAFVAAVFAVHPLHVESVAWVSERKDVLSGLFFVLTLWAYACYAEQARVKHSRPGVWYGLALGLFALGLMCKPMLVTLPFVLLLLDYWPLARIQSSKFNLQNFKWLLVEKLPFLALVAVDAVVTIWAQKESLQAGANIGIPSRLGNAVTTYVTFLYQLFYPTGLAVFYPHPGSHQSLWQMAGSLLVLVLISAGVVACHRRHPFLPVGWLWYLGMLVPVIGIMQTGSQARYDHYTYLPQIGLYVMLAWGLVAWCSNRRYCRVVLGTGAVAVLVGHMVVARIQTAYWKNNISLWTHTLACTTGNDVAHINLGCELDLQGKLAEASQQAELALQINPDDALAYVILSKVMIDQKKWAEAIQNCQLALQLAPDNKTAAVAHNNIGFALEQQGKLAEASQQAELALQIDPDDALAYVILSKVMIDQEQWAEAIQNCQLALQLAPDNKTAAMAHNNIGYALSRQGQLEAANEQYKLAIQLNPDLDLAQINWGNALFLQGKWAEAIGHYDRTLQLNPEDANAQNHIGMALVDLGRPEEALPHFQQALNLATAQNNTALVETISKEMKSVQSAWLKVQKP